MDMEKLGTVEQAAQGYARGQLEKGRNLCSEGCANFFVEDSDVARRKKFLEQYVSDHPTNCGNHVSKRPRAAFHLEPDILRAVDIPPEISDGWRKFVITGELEQALAKKMRGELGFDPPKIKSSDPDNDFLDEACLSFKGVTKQQPQFVIDSDSCDKELAQAINYLICRRSPHYSVVVGVSKFSDIDSWPSEASDGRRIENGRNLDTIDFNPHPWDIMLDEA